MFCPLHRHQRVLSFETCPICEREGIEVITCEIDKIPRVMDSMGQNRQSLHPHSFAVLAFYKKETPMKIGIPDDIAKRHSKAGGKSYFTGTQEALFELIQDNWDKRKPGYGKTDLKDVVVVPLPSEYFVGTTVKVDVHTVLRAAVRTRFEGEEPFIGVQATYQIGTMDGQPTFLNAEPDPCTHAWAVLYRRGLLNAEELVGVVYGADWVIVMLGAADTDDQPMHPISLARNFLERKGGTKASYTAEEFARSIWYWKDRCGVAPE